MISINRVSKVVRGGRTMSFSVLAVVGDGNGSVGIGKGKAREVPAAVKKAMNKGRKNMSKIYINNGTVFHNIIGKHSSSKIIIIPARDGTGIIAGGPVRSVFEVIGIRNVIAKIIGSSNPYNVVLATLNGLKESLNPLEISLKRGKSIKIFSK